jgi:hypothetical protein
MQRVYTAIEGNSLIVTAIFGFKLFAHYITQQMDFFTVAISLQTEVEASCKTAWDVIHDYEEFHTIFSTVFFAESIGKDRRSVGHKVKITRLLPSGHCFLATWATIRHEEENMEVQFYSEDLAGLNKASVSTTWTVTPIPDEPNRCILTISIALVPRSLFIYAGRLVFTPFIKKLVRRTVKQDLRDFAAYCSTSKGELERTDSTEFCTETDQGSVITDETTSRSVICALKSEDDDLRIPVEELSCAAHSC